MEIKANKGTTTATDQSGEAGGWGSALAQLQTWDPKCRRILTS